MTQCGLSSGLLELRRRCKYDFAPPHHRNEWLFLGNVCMCVWVCILHKTHLRFLPSTNWNFGTNCQNKYHYYCITSQSSLITGHWLFWGLINSQQHINFENVASTTEINGIVRVLVAWVRTLGHGAVIPSIIETIPVFPYMTLITHDLVISDPCSPRLFHEGIFSIVKISRPWDFLKTTTLRFVKTLMGRYRLSLFEKCRTHAAK